MTNTKTWQSKLLDEPRIGFVEEHGSRAANAERAMVVEQQQKPTPPPPPPPKHDPLAKILNEPRVGFETIHRSAPRSPK
ncbi:hypothetical protein [Tardiphaga sp. 709]|uniref:hypothetical protein n=1 Tax=Tardiphaga sp. 709 TaxID=3076039 RepID=UPI0028E5F0F6|nr:hypothetical protein [Tardiphaga sp. 709]WNV09126.1 hypothetical protein RSO67_27295 [Tardiphaga sp. 709]